MTHGKNMIRRGRLQLGLVLVVLALFLMPEPWAMAVPRDPPPATDQVAQHDRGPTLLARRRRRHRRHYPRRRHRRRKPRAKKKAPQPAPQPAARETPTPSQPQPAVDPGNLRRGGRVEFDGRLVQGQTAKSGAIYLFARKRSELRSMVQERTNYRKEVLRTVYPSWEPKKK